MGSPTDGDGAPKRGYAVAHLRDVRMGQEIASYLREIDNTLRTFNGRFLIHGGRATVLEGPWSGNLIVIEFPTPEHAASWYASEAYQRILPLRLQHADGWAIVAEGVSSAHVATDVLTPETKQVGTAALE